MNVHAVIQFEDAGASGVGIACLVLQVRLPRLLTLKGNSVT